MQTRALVALAVVVAALFVAVYLTQSLQPPVAASSPPTWVPVAEEEFSRLAAMTPRDTVVALGTLRPESTPAKKPTPTPFVSRNHGKFLIAGWATNWPAQGAAASKWLAREMGGGRDYLGQSVRIWCYGNGCLSRNPVDVKLVTSCACGDRHGEHTVIDLPIYAFELLSDYSVGVIHVRVETLP